MPSSQALWRQAIVPVFPGETGEAGNQVRIMQCGHGSPPTVRGDDRAGPMSDRVPMVPMVPTMHGALMALTPLEEVPRDVVDSPRTVTRSCLPD